MLVLMVRTIVVYAVVILSVRIMGKRQIGELQPTELVVTIIISELAAIPMVEEGTPLLRAMLPIFIIVAFELLMSALGLLHPFINKLIEGSPSFLVINGKVQEKEMRKQRVTMEDVYESIRIAGFFSIEEISFAILETNGKMSFLPKPEYKPVTAGDMKIMSQDKGTPVILIADGDICKSGVKFYGHDNHWLDMTLRKLKIQQKEVFLLTVDMTGGFYCIKKSDLTF